MRSSAILTKRRWCRASEPRRRSSRRGWAARPAGTPHRRHGASEDTRVAQPTGHGGRARQILHDQLGVTHQRHVMDGVAVMGAPWGRFALAARPGSREPFGRPADRVSALGAGTQRAVEDEVVIVAWLLAEPVHRLDEPRRRGGCAGSARGPGCRRPSVETPSCVCSRPAYPSSAARSSTPGPRR